MKNWNIEAETGYKPQTTFYTDLSIAEQFGVAGIKDTVKRVLQGWSDNAVYITEFVMALNWKIWEHYNTNPPLAKVYNQLWDETALYVENHLTGEDLQYYYRTTD